MEAEKDKDKVAENTTKYKKVFIVCWSDCGEMQIDNIYSDEEKAAKRTTALNASLKRNHPSDEAWYFGRDLL